MPTVVKWAVLGFFLVDSGFIIARRRIGQSIDGCFDERDLCLQDSNAGQQAVLFGDFRPVLPVFLYAHVVGCYVPIEPISCPALESVRGYLAQFREIHGILQGATISLDNVVELVTAAQSVDEAAPEIREFLPLPYFAPGIAAGAPFESSDTGRQ